MGLTSALYSGLSGLNANQTTLNVVANNIANVNTVAFKVSTALFSPQSYTTDQAGTAPSADFGGTNPSQEGLGTQISSIERDFSQGTVQTTGVDTDMAINGDGFFITQDPTGQNYTRDGAFTLNSANQLVNTSGAFIQGFGVDNNGNVIPGSLGNITIPLGQVTIARPTQNVSIQGNLNSAGAVASGATILLSQSFTDQGAAPTDASLLVNLRTTDATPTALVQAGDVLTLAGTRGSRQLPASTLTVTAATTVGDLEGFINEALGIDTTVNEPGNPTPGATLVGGAGSGQLGIIGNTGDDNALTLGTAGISDSSGATPFPMASGSVGGFTNDPSGESTHTTISAYDSLGTPITIDLTTVLESESDAGETWRFYATSPDATGASGQIVGDGTLTFGTDGELLSSTGTTISVPRTGTGAISPVTMNLDFSSVTSLASNSSNLVMSAQDGLPVGTLSSFSVGTDGTITGQYSNGQDKALGQLALAMFNNPQGLVDDGNNSFSAGADSGPPIIAAPGSLGSGQVGAGCLEQSNVDISKEFINLIIASTGFNASSKVISTSDQLLTSLLQSQA